VALAVEGIDAVELEQFLRRGSRGSGLGRHRRAARADIDRLDAGVAARILGGAVHQNLAVIHDGYGVSHLEYPVDVMLDQQHGDVGGQRLDQAGDARALGGGETGQRLVEQQDARLGSERQPHIQQALAAIAERGSLGALGPGKAGPAQQLRRILAHAGQRLGGAPDAEPPLMPGLHG
jgi:hypothetical protein